MSSSKTFSSPPNHLHSFSKGNPVSIKQSILPLSFHPLAVTNMLFICGFIYSSKRNHKTLDFLCLTSFTKLIMFEGHLCRSMNQYFIPLWIINIPLHGNAAFYLSFHQLKDIWVALYLLAVVSSAAMNVNVHVIV